MKKLMLSHEEAEIIGIQTLTFIASDPAQLECLAINTGVSAEGPRQRAGTSEILLACLGKILKKRAAFAVVLNKFKHSTRARPNC